MHDIHGRLPCVSLPRGSIRVACLLIVGGLLGMPFRSSEGIVELWDVRSQVVLQALSGFLVLLRYCC